MTIPFDQIPPTIWVVLYWFATGGNAKPPPTSAVRAAVGVGLLYGGAVAWALRRPSSKWGGVWITNLGLSALHWRAGQLQQPMLTPALPLPMASAGDRNYVVGDQMQAVEPAEDCVLQAFFRQPGANRATARWIALDKPSLVMNSGYDDAARILKRIKIKYPVLAPAIDCPGKKGQGGLKVYAGKRQKAHKT
jgi:hypothetical protein